MTRSVTDACRSERLHYRPRPALGDRDLSSRHRGLFEALDRETDPVLIAQQADERPVFPSLEAADNGVTGAATSAESEPAVIGIMDPHAAPDSIDSWAPPVETGPEPAEPAEPAAAAIGPGGNNTGQLIQTMPVHRPMSWLRRDSNGGGRREPRRLTKISGVDDVRSSAVAGCD
jgi:hypothetical protein